MQLAIVGKRRVVTFLRETIITILNYMQCITFDDCVAVYVSVIEKEGSQWVGILKYEQSWPCKPVWYN